MKPAIPIICLISLSNYPASQESLKENNGACQLFYGSCRANGEGLTIDDVINDTRAISLWTINSDEFAFLKEWTYERRNEQGKQLFRLSDYNMNYTISDYGGSFI